MSTSAGQEQSLPLSDRLQYMMLVGAAAAGDTDLLTELNEEGVSLNLSVPTEKVPAGSALTWSRFYRTKHVFERLLDLGAIPNLGTISGDPDPYWLIESIRRSPNLLDIVVQTSSPFAGAVEQHRPLHVLILLSAGFDPRQSIPGSGTSLLGQAVSRRHFEIAYMLIDTGVEVDEHAISAIIANLRSYRDHWAVAPSQRVWYWRCLDAVADRGLLDEVTLPPDYLLRRQAMQLSEMPARRSPLEAEHVEFLNESFRFVDDDSTANHRVRKFLRQGESLDGQWQLMLAFHDYPSLEDRLGAVENLLEARQESSPRAHLLTFQLFDEVLAQAITYPADGRYVEYTAWRFMLRPEGGSQVWQVVHRAHGDEGLILLSRDGEPAGLPLPIRERYSAANSKCADRAHDTNQGFLLQLIHRPPQPSDKEQTSAAP